MNFNYAVKLKYDHIKDIKIIVNNGINITFAGNWRRSGGRICTFYLCSDIRFKLDYRLCCYSLRILYVAIMRIYTFHLSLSDIRYSYSRRVLCLGITQPSLLQILLFNLYPYHHLKISEGSKCKRYRTVIYEESHV